MAHLGDQRLAPDLRAEHQTARPERGPGNRERERWRGLEAGQARGQAGLAGPGCAARSRAFSLVEFPPQAT